MRIQWGGLACRYRRGKHIPQQPTGGEVGLAVGDVEARRGIRTTDAHTLPAASETAEDSTLRGDVNLASELVVALSPLVRHTSAAIDSSPVGERNGQDGEHKGCMAQRCVS